MNDKIIDLLKKLKELADRGVDGEKQTAERMLQQMMKKHGITWEELNGDERTDHEFFASKDQKQFLHQVAASVLGRITVQRLVKDRKYKKSIFIKCTDAEFIEINAKFNFYWQAYQRDLDTFYHAFIQKNRLFKKPEESDYDNQPEITPKERARLMKLSLMMEGLDRHQFHKQLKPAE
jgi:hypothetical protein